MENQTISLLDTHPALLLTILPGFQVAKDWPEEGDPVEAIVNAHPEPLYLIVDLRQANLYRREAGALIPRRDFERFAVVAPNQHRWTSLGPFDADESAQSI